jgi:hypothetical protein
MADGSGCSPCDAGDGGEGGEAAAPLDCGAQEAGGPSLTSLSVAGATLVPDFSPDTLDYYVRCGGGTADLTASVMASAGTTTSLQVETPGTPKGTLTTVGSTAQQQTVHVTLSENEALVATATLGPASQEYWIRCVPPNFPEMQWTTRANGCTRTPGYYLIGTMTGGTGFSIVFDTNGAPVWYSYPGAEVYDVETLDAGLISFSAGGWQVDQLGGPTSFPAVDGYEGGTPPVSPDEHELRILPNGHYLGLSAGREYVDLTGVTVPAPGGGSMTYGPNTLIYACYVQEFDNTGTVVWEWSATDHFDPALIWVLRGNGDLAESQAEPFHCNSIDVDPANGNLLVSARHMNSVFYIDKSTKKVLWKMGGAPCTSGASGKACLDDPPPTFIPLADADKFYGQHDARLQPGWSWTETCSGGTGKISLFDDESYQGKPARGVVYDVQIAGQCADGGTTSATSEWTYDNWVDGGVPSAVTGSFRISKDGSRVIGWGQSDPVPNGLVFTEVDIHGNDLLDLICPDDTSSYRAVKVPTSAFDLNALRYSSAQ